MKHDIDYTKFFLLEAPIFNIVLLKYELLHSKVCSGKGIRTVKSDERQTDSVFLTSTKIPGLAPWPQPEGHSTATALHPFFRLNSELVFKLISYRSVITLALRKRLLCILCITFETYKEYCYMGQVSTLKILCLNELRNQNKLQFSSEGSYTYTVYKQDDARSQTGDTYFLAFSLLNL